MTKLRMAGMATGCWALACGSSDPARLDELRIARLEIETDAELQTEPGFGAGVHIEYRNSGDWRIFATCDTELSGYLCDFDVIASVEPPSRITNIRAEDLEYSDFLGRIDRGALQFMAFTGYDVDVVRFVTEPGEPLRIDVLLDGTVVPESVLWPRAGTVQRSAPTMPLELVPSVP